ncbi:MAG: hypothetical protein HUK20_13485 [Fibrobacter sp.]|nr:hypothetical protein [Fibrobacter sp.]
MIFRFFKLFCVALGFGLVLGCSDDDDAIEFKFDREVTELSVLRNCLSDSSKEDYCMQIRLRYPMETEDFTKIYMWVDTTVVGDTSKEVSGDQLEKATKVFEYQKGTKSLYDTIDMSPYIKEFIKERDSLMVAFFCEYSDNDDPGSVQRMYLHFGDDNPPSLVALHDSVWTTGAMFEWNRPTDQTDYYATGDLSGPIVGYNIKIYSPDKAEDLRKLKVTISNDSIVDSTGSTLYKRHYWISSMRIKANGDSGFVDTVSHGDDRKNYLFLSVLDGKGYDTSSDEANNFRMIIEGLKAEHEYTIGITSFDTAGNPSGNADAPSDKLQLFITTDSIAPLMPTKLFTLNDSLYPELARLDSNNRLRIFWSVSVDPLDAKHGIGVDTVLAIPRSCIEQLCYKSVASYKIDYYDPVKKDWFAYDYAGGSVERYTKLYEVSGDSMRISQSTSAGGLFVTDTIRWVAPGDTLIIRVRSVDSSQYYSKALIDTIVVSPGALANELECPEGFVAVAASDTNKFCMERLEHQDSSGNFVNNVLHSEAKAACEGISADGFEVGLCNERDWELVCLSGGKLSYGVVEEDLSSAEEYLFASCNVATNDSVSAFSREMRSTRCMNPMGVRDMPGQLQEWVLGRSKDTVAVLKGASFRIFTGLDRDKFALCTTRSFPYYTRPAYTTDTVYIYREGTRVDTLYVADTSRTIYKKLTTKDFKDSLQFFKVLDSNGNEIGEDYALYSEYKKGGGDWLDTLSNGLTYVPDQVKVVFLTGEKVAYREVSEFYKSNSIGFRCCAYPKK